MGFIMFQNSLPIGRTVHSKRLSGKFHEQFIGIRYN